MPPFGIRRFILPTMQEICRSLDLDLRGQTSASFNMRLNYERCLLDFEHYISNGQYLSDLATQRAPSTDIFQQAVPAKQTPKNALPAGYYSPLLLPCMAGSAHQSTSGLSPPPSPPPPFGRPRMLYIAWYKQPTKITRPANKSLAVCLSLRIECFSSMIDKLR